MVSSCRSAHTVPAVVACLLCCFGTVLGRVNDLSQVALPCGEECGHVIGFDTANCIGSSDRSHRYFFAVLSAGADAMYLVNAQNLSYTTYSPPEVGQSRGGGRRASASPREMSVSATSCTFAVPFSGGVALYSFANLPDAGVLEMHFHATGTSEDFTRVLLSDAWMLGLDGASAEPEVALFNVSVWGVVERAVSHPLAGAARGLCGSADVPAEAFTTAQAAVDIDTWVVGPSDITPGLPLVPAQPDSPVQPTECATAALGDANTTLVFALGLRNISAPDSSDEAEGAVLLMSWVETPVSSVIVTAGVRSPSDAECASVSVASDRDGMRVITCSGVFSVETSGCGALCGALSLEDDDTFPTAAAAAYVRYDGGSLNVPDSGDRKTRGILAASRSPGLVLYSFTVVQSKNLVAAVVLIAIGGVLILGGALYYVVKRISLAKGEDEDTAPLAT